MSDLDIFARHVADLSELDGQDSRSAANLARIFSDHIEIEVKTRQIVSTGPPGAMGFAHVKMEERRFYSVKVGNLLRDRAGAAGLAGYSILGGMGIAAMISAGSAMLWPGIGTLVAAALIAASRGKPLIATFNFDEATALSLAWDHSRRERGFRLVEVADLVSRLGEAESVYGNHGFNEAKLLNALGQLKALRIVANAGTGRYQLIEDVKITNDGTVRLLRAMD